MPTYEYICTSCGLEFEVFQSITSDAITVCTSDVCTQQHAGEGTVQRKISKGAGIIFNGSGFYGTDYKDKTPAASSSTPTKSVSAESTKPVSDTPVSAPVSPPPTSES